MVGVASAKALALSLGLPLYGVNHLASHVAVDIVEHGPLPEPTMALLVSGGHSSLLLVHDVTSDVRPLGSTIDDAAGAQVIGLQTTDKARVGASPVFDAKRVMIGSDHTPGLIEIAAMMFRSGLFPPNPSSVLCSERYCARWHSCVYHE